MIIVPHLAGMLHQQTRQWADEHNATLVELATTDRTAYWRLLADHWRQPGDLLVVEQDIVPAAGVVDAMLACDHSWCVSPYWAVNRWLVDGLGCTKLSAALKSRVPWALDAVGQMAGPDAAARDWSLLDWRLSRLLRSQGCTPHEHDRSTHLHDYGGSAWPTTVTPA